ncbi:MAG: hypothetical protein JW849_04980 [Phycisphaerae bacterium]|nr:hypothetical protein [Phycisphaerae bacterium]
MKRKLLLMVGSFILLLLAFGTYQLFVPGVAFFDPTGGARLRPPSLGFTGEGPGIGRTKGVTFYYRNPEGQLRGVYKATSWTKEDDGSFLLENPEAIVYQRDGTRVYLRADHGQFWAEEVAGGSGFNIRHGQADGRVEIFYDQSTDDDYHGEERPHPKDRPYEEMIHDVIRIVTNDVKFSQDMLELRTESEVTVWSRQLDMNGRGLLLQWNEDPREMRLLRLEKGNILVVKDLPEPVDLTQLPTEEKQAAATQPAAAAETPVAATTSPAVEDGWGLVKASTAPQKGVKPGRDVNVVVGPQPEAEKNKTPAAQPISAAGPKMRNIYQATFHRDVRVFSGTRSLTGADDLSLSFEWDRAWRPEENKAAAPATTAPAKTAVPAIAEAKEKAPAAPAGASDTPASSPLPQAGPTSQPKFASPVAAAGVRDMKLDEEQARASDTQMAIYWDGPLEILPLGRTEAPSRKRYTIAGNGKQVRLTDEDARILCTRFEFKNPQQEAWFEGTKKSPSRVQLARGDEITCRGRIRFIRSLGKAYLEGPGKLVRYARDEEMSNWNVVPVDQAPWRLLLDRVTWGERVEASFGERKMPVGDRSETRPYIKEAAFFENVKMVQFLKPTPHGKDGEKKSFIEAANRLHIWMGVTDEGRNYPSKAEADGKVYALQEGSDIQADWVAVEFQPKAENEDAPTPPAVAASQPSPPPPPPPAEDSLTTNSPEAAKIAKADAPEESEPDAREDDDPLSALGGGVEPTSVKASGDVKVTYHRGREPDEPPLRIEADMLDVNVARELAVLTGAPAKLWQGDRNIEGEVINFDRGAEAVKVTGAGQLRFYTNQDLSGNRLEKPRPVKIAWADWMLYHGQAGQCVFNRNVDFDSAGEKIACPRQMRIFFLPKDSGAPAADDARPVPRGARSLSMGIDDFSSAKFSRIEADGEADEKFWVRMQTQRMHPRNENWVLQRMQIRGQQILYDDVKGFAYVNGPGDFLAEDYRKPSEQPAERRLGDANVIGGQIDRPNQTLFRWKKAMALNQTSRHVRLQDGVEMVHRSGSKMIKLPALETQPFGRLEKGRLSTLHAGVMDAWFGEPKTKLPARDEHGRIKESDGGGQDLLQAGPEFGDLQKFKAEKDVTLQMADDGYRYGTTTIDGEKIFYDAVREVIEVTGFPEGAASRTEAQITIEDRQAGVPPKTVRSPVLIYDLKNDVIKVPSLTGGGGQ